MKTFLAVALVVATGLAALSVWGIVHSRQMSGSSSQIFIHGAPVCVTQRGGEIEAVVGKCGSIPGDPGSPNLGLPPGHPPVDGNPGPAFDEERRTPI